jgi:hypothetical protein
MTVEKNLVDAFKDIASLSKDNIIEGCSLATSIYEENLKAIYKQLDRWISIVEDYSIKLKEFSEKLPKEINGYWGNNPKMLNGYFDHLFDSYKDYLDLVKGISSTLTKEQITLLKKNADKGQSMLFDYLNLLKSWFAQ